MYELAPPSYEQAGRAFADLDVHLAVKALLAGLVPGRAWADDPEQPRSVLAQVGGRFYLGGWAGNEDFNGDLSRFFSERVYPKGLAAGWWGFVLKCATAEWAGQVEVLLPGRRVLPHPHHYYAGEEVRHDWQAMVPAGIALRPVDRALLEEGLEGREELEEEMCSERPSVAEFLQKSFGFVPLHGRRIVGWCLSEYNCGDRCEVGIATAEGYRRRGLATIVGSALVEHARARGIAHVGWHCEADNAASIATALKLGFAKVAEYPVYECPFRQVTAQA